jgi:hypothetical protein
MIDWSDLPPAELEELRAAIANSEIALRRLALAARLADWENTRKAPDVDEVILAWLASHRRRGFRAALI